MENINRFRFYAKIKVLWYRVDGEMYLRAFAELKHIMYVLSSSSN